MSPNPPESFLPIPNTTRDFLQRLSLPIAHTFNLSELPQHFPILVAAFTFFQLLQLISPVVLYRVSPEHFGKADRRTRRNWIIRVVSMAHVLIVIPLSFACLNSPELGKNRAFGFSDRLGTLIAITCGFVWDLIDCIVNYTTIGFVIHAAACLTVFSQAFRPFLGYYGPRFLLWELSTPFLTIHWFLDKTKRSGSTIQVVNGVLLLATFFFTRICYGGLMSYHFFQTLQEVRSQLPASLTFAYAAGNITLQGLNWFWFYKMLQSLGKRFAEKKAPKTATNGDYLAQNERKME